MVIIFVSSDNLQPAPQPSLAGTQSSSSSHHHQLHPKLCWNTAAAHSKPYWDTAPAPPLTPTSSKNEPCALLLMLCCSLLVALQLLKTYGLRMF